MQDQNPPTPQNPSSGNHLSQNQSPRKGPEKPTPPRMGRKELASSSKEAPENVIWGVRCWYVVAVLQAIQAILSAVAFFLTPRAFAQFADTVSESGVQIPEGVPLKGIIGLSVLSTAFFSLLATVICAYLVYRVSRGAVYSRMMLNVGSIYLIIMAVMTLFSERGGSTPLFFVLAQGLVMIASGVTAACGMYFLSRPDTRSWFGIPEPEVLDRYAEKQKKYQEEQNKIKKAEKEKKAQKKEKKR